MAARSPKIPGARFSVKKKTSFFEIHRTSDNNMGSLDLCNHAFGLNGTSISQSSVYKVK